MLYFDEAVEFIDNFIDVNDIDDKFDLVNKGVCGLYFQGKISQNAAENLLQHYHFKLKGECYED